jgi:hypothetical protein
MINSLKYVGPPHRALIEGEAITVYETATPLGADEIFNISKIRDHVYDELEGGEWIDWGAARYILLYFLADEAGAADGVLLEYTEDGETSAGAMYEATYDEEAPVVPGVMAKRGIGFRFSWTNGATLQAAFSVKVQVAKNLEALAVSGTRTDYSGTIAEAATSQEAYTVTAGCRSLELSNPMGDPETGSVLHYSWNAAAVTDTEGSSALIPGATRTWTRDELTVGDVLHIISADASAPFTLQAIE